MNRIPLPAAAGPEQMLDSLRVQLGELNSRTRFYTQQLWQIPLAYLGVVGLTFSRIPATTEWLWVTVLFTALIGVAVLFHMAHSMKRLRLGVANLQEVEGMLQLPGTRAHYTGGGIYPLLAIVWVVTAAGPGLAWWFSYYKPSAVATSSHCTKVRCVVSRPGRLHTNRQEQLLP
jgi:hypothetical protein